ncbi:SDR family NAD(P)-dependent oxidoreductase [Usitatibacter palustris]|uniref:Putative oxidoreductase YciK n=1 Tax=Usitatibacter palustris TaxID=2732487 RepID=A0A6M4H7R2_9PROT|nr:SDR family NAD(P)-dependent oxidoreductase [Usitatibacter palustris]QJR15656.1 putative oxidoreductase YciK [Usitatibacter palustris]
MNDPVAALRGYQPSPDLLGGRVILVTGAGQGLGRAVALACAGHGATVALLGRKPEKLEATADAIEAAGGAEPLLVPLDLAAADQGAFERFAQLLRREATRLDGIAHCASHFVPLGPLAEQSLDTWLTLLRVNLAAPFALTNACLPLLTAAPASSVVFTGETHGAAPAAYWGGFAVGKSALPALATIWSGELEKSGRTRMNVLVPGPIATPQRARSHPGEDRARLRAPEEAARAYLYLLGDASAEVAGKTLIL